MADATSEERRQAKVAASMGSISRAGAADTTAEYDRLVLQAVELVNTPALDFLSAKERKLFLEKNLKKAESQCRRAIELDPARPAAYYALGCAHNASADGMAAAASFVKAMEFAHDEFSTEWANAAMHAFATLMANASAPRPAWWADAQLLVYSERALTALPETTLTLLWRAQVLSGLPLTLPPLATQRSAEQLRTAATHYTAVAKLLSSKEEKRAAVEEAAACLSCLAALAELGVVAGAFVSAIDLVGIVAEGGPEEAVAAGLIVPVPY